MIETITSWLNSEERGVSPVIGVILMVAITVIMAAVIGTFVLGLGDQIGDTQPTTSLDISESDGDIEVEHSGGDAVSWDDIRFTVNGADDSDNFTPQDGNEFAIGDTVTNGEYNDEEVTVRIIHIPTDSYLATEDLTIPNTT